MVRPSPQTERLVEIIEMLAAMAGGCSLAEISRHLGINKATIYPMVTELVSVGWLARDPRTKLFSLGPRLVVVGKAAEQSFSIVELARSRSLALAQSLDATCLLLTEGAEGLLVLDIVVGSARTRQNNAGGIAIGLRPGDNVSFRPPLASVFAAWGDSHRRAEWLAMVEPAQDAAFEKLLDIVYERGYVVEDFPPEPHPLGAMVEDTAGSIYGSKRARRLQQGIAPTGNLRLVSEIIDDNEYYPVSINAPILDAGGHVLYALIVTDIEGPVSGKEVSRIGESLVETTRLISLDGMGGRQ